MMLNMKTTKRLTALFSAAALTALTAFPALAAVEGSLDSVSSSEISGWAWETGQYDTVVTVEIQIYPDGADTPAKTVTTLAEQYDPDLSASIGDGWHHFSIPVDWSGFSGDEFVVKAYSVTDEAKTPLGNALSYTRGQSGATYPGPGDALEHSEETVSPPEAEPVQEAEPVPEKPEATVPVKEAAVSETTAQVDPENLTYLGPFLVTGYCSCAKCSGGHNYTYSGTIPQPGHTLSADLSKFPIGTKLMINGVVYTVEDMGSGVDGSKVDIYFATHAEALAQGTQTEDVYLVN